MKKKIVRQIPEVLVTGRHTSITKTVKDYVKEKILRAVKNVPKVHGIHVILDVERFKKKAEAVIVLNHMKIRAAADSEDIMTSIDIVVDKVQKQINKYKEKQKEHRDMGIKELTIHEEYAPQLYEEEIERRPRLIKSRDFYPKPMSIEEAMMQLNITPDLFLVFNNAQTNQINVVYRRKDGNIGLVEPD